MNILQERHKEVVLRKRERIAMYRTLIDTWEQHEDADPHYLTDLRRRLHTAENQLKAMKP